jgi:hypothetical protein
MAFLKIPYEEALQNHPEAVQEALASLRKGKSKHRNEPPENFAWGYYWCVVIESGVGSIRDVLSGAMSRATQDMSIDAQVQDYGRRCHVHLQLEKNRAYGRSERLPTPQRFLDSYRQNLEERALEQARVDALSPEERQRETEAILQQLRKPGFIEIRIPTRTR